MAKLKLVLSSVTERLVCLVMCLRKAWKTVKVGLRPALQTVLLSVVL